MVSQDLFGAFYCNAKELLGFVLSAVHVITNPNEQFKWSTMSVFFLL